MKQFEVGLVGCGHISTAHLNAFRKTAGCEVMGVFDLNRELAEERAAEFKVPVVYDDLSELIDSSDVVDVCTPPQTHAEIAQQVITARRHLVIEKPLVIEMTDWYKMAKMLAQSPIKIAVIHNQKYIHAVRQAKHWVDQGRIGEVIRVRREFLTSPSTDRMLVGDGHWSHKLPGGRWFETMPHELYLTHYFAGPLALEHVAVAHTERASSGAPADEVVITLKGEHCLATIHFSANCDQNRRVFTLVGTKGVITVDVLSDFATISRLAESKARRAIGQPLLEAGQTLLRAIPNRLSYLERRVRRDTPHSALIQAFGRHLQGEGPAPTPIEEVDYVVRKCEQIGRAIDAEVRKVQ